MGEAIVEVRDLKVWFPLARSVADFVLRRQRRYVHAVDGVSFRLERRETLCLVGESGCGKTTTAKTLLRLVPPRNIVGGKVLIRPKPEAMKVIESVMPEAVEDGMVDIYKLRGEALLAMKREIQIIFQDPFASLNPRFRVVDILEEPMIVHKVGSPEERKRRIYQALETVKLYPPEDFLYRYPHQLSGGQRQRISIARALVLNPSILVADEPVSMLDVSIRAEVLEVLDELKKAHGMSVLFITHDLALARYVCDRIAVMYLGRIVEVGRSEEVIRDPLHPYTKALINAIPEPTPENRKVVRQLRIKGEVTSAVNLPRGCRFRPRCIGYEENPWVRPKCESEEPGLIYTGEDRGAACWLVK